MGFNKLYRALFNVEILHHYFLDEGEDIYGAGLDADKMDKNLGVYQFSQFMDVQPTKETIRTLKNMRSRFVQSYHGFSVYTSTDGDSPFIPFPEDLRFDFIARISDQFFENYTDITIDRSEPLFLSNQTPASSLEETATPVRFCLASNFETTLTNGINPSLPMVKMDIDLKEIDSQELIGAFAIIRIHLNGEAGEIKLTDIDNVGNLNGANEFNGTLPEVNWMFKNRSTTWKYHRSKDSVQVHETTGEKPLTKHGYVPVNDGTIDYPNPSARLIYKGEFVGEDVNKKYSRIFI